MDTADIVAGAEFKTVLAAEIRSASLMLAIIGPHWAGGQVPTIVPNRSASSTLLRGLGSGMPNGLINAAASLIARGIGKDKEALVFDALNGPDYVSRIQTNDDMIRFELTEAFNAKKPVLPVLIDGASLPSDILPPPLDRLTNLHHIKLARDTVDETIPTLMKALRAHLT